MVESLGFQEMATRLTARENTRIINFNINFLSLSKH
jgi:hypothetical protein